MDTSPKPAGAHVVLYRYVPTGSKPALAVLLCKRTLDAPSHPGTWSLFGGKTEANDASAIRTALREVAEELGIGLDPRRVRPLGDVSVPRDDAPHTVAYFCAPLDCDMSQLTLRLQLDSCIVEGEGLGWFTAEEIGRLPVRPEDRVAIDRFFAGQGR
jgi:8-oxo-dGTP pyrophosphatase MutT (NUDIX family)